MEQDDVLKWALSRWGAEKQKEMAIEECAEFIVAAQKTKRAGGREIDADAIANLIDETADVFITNRQMMLMLGVEAVQERIAFKIERLNTRLASLS